MTKLIHAPISALDVSVFNTRQHYNPDSIAELWSRVSKDWIFDHATAIGAGIQAIASMTKRDMSEVLHRWFANPEALTATDLNSQSAKVSEESVTIIRNDIAAWAPPGMAFEADEKTDGAEEETLHTEAAE